MHIFSQPSWIQSQYMNCKDPDQLPQRWFDTINENLARLNAGPPIVSVVIPAFNEEVNIALTIESLSKNITGFSTEIIVVNNNSTDRTRETLQKLHVITIDEPLPGAGPARQAGQEIARGKYILTADGDCLYPPGWIEGMTRALMKKGVVCVYGGYSFIETRSVPRWQFFLYECVRRAITEVRHVKRPHINCMGMNMGYHREHGLAIGFIRKQIRGEDGRFCFQLSQLGRIHYVRSKKVRIWTLPRTLELEGGLFHAFVIRVLVEFARLPEYIRRQPNHDVTRSRNTYSKLADLFRRKIQKRDSARERVSQAQVEVGSNHPNLNP